MAPSTDSNRKRFTVGRPMLIVSIVGLIAVLVAIAAGCMYLLKPAYPKPDNIAAPPGNFRFTFGVSDLYAPLFTPEENAAVLNNLAVDQKIYATYRRTTYTYALISCEVGVGCWPEPHWVEQSTEEKREFPVTTSPNKGPDGARTLSVDMPQSLDGGYSLAELFMTMSPNTFYRQPSYRALFAKTVTELSSLDRDPAPPTFDYLVSFSNEDQEPQDAHRQDCLSVQTPLGFPDISIPIVTHVTTSSKRMSLMRLFGNDPCPLADVDFSDAPGVVPGHLPLSRIAAAQVEVDFDTVHKATHLEGMLPVVASMPRWFQRGIDGVDAYLIEVGPFRRLTMRVRGDASHLVNGIYPSFRIETWTFFNDALVGYSGYISYDTQAEKVDDEPAIRWKEYFHDGKSVWSKIQPTHCDDQGCKEALAETSIQTSKVYEDLQAEARSYVQLRGALKPSVGR